MGSFMWNSARKYATDINPFAAPAKSGWGMHPSNLWQQPGGSILPGTQWTGQAPSLAGASAGYTPQSYVKAAGSFLNPATQPNYGGG